MKNQMTCLSNKNLDLFTRYSFSKMLLESVKTVLMTLDVKSKQQGKENDITKLIRQSVIDMTDTVLIQEEIYNRMIQCESINQYYFGELLKKDKEIRELKEKNDRLLDMF